MAVMSTEIIAGNYFRKKEINEKVCSIEVIKEFRILIELEDRETEQMNLVVCG